MTAEIRIPAVIVQPPHSDTDSFDLPQRTDTVKFNDFRYNYYWQERHRGIGMGQLRKCCVRGRFYPYSAEECREQIESFTNSSGAGNFEGIPRAGIVPHAGWAFSGSTAGRVFASLRKKSEPDTFVLFGAVHRHLGDDPVVMTQGEWETPLGNIRIDEAAADLIVKEMGDGVRTGSGPHEMEHSLEVQVPFIRLLFPSAKIVPVLVPPYENSIRIGAAVGRIASENPGIFVLGSTDLTHYGPEYGFSPKGTGETALKWVKEVNDKRIIDFMCEMRTGKILSEAREHHNACGAGAAAAAAAAAAEIGSGGGILLEYTTSHDVMPRGAPSMFVGYAGIIFTSDKNRSQAV